MCAGIARAFPSDEGLDEIDELDELERPGSFTTASHLYLSESVCVCLCVSERKRIWLRVYGDLRTAWEREKEVAIVLLYANPAYD